MSHISLVPPLFARNGKTLKVILPGRVSDIRPGKQSNDSLEDQANIQLQWLNDHTHLSIEVTKISGSGSGELLERKEFVELLELIKTEEFDLVLPEDLGRIARRVDAYQVCELCEDHNVRLIAINNHNVDTATPGWRDAAFFCSYFYEKDNLDKSTRLKGRLRSRFTEGGALPGLIYGYVLPQKTDAHQKQYDTDVYKDEAAEPIYKEWFRKLEHGAFYSEIADWLNEQGIPVGPSCFSNTKWDGRLVRNTSHNTLLKGVRKHNERITRRENKTGKYKSEKASPEQLQVRQVPLLAFFNEEYYDHVIALADERNSKFRRGKKNGKDPLRLRARKRTVFPGQSIYCGVCGSLFVYGGHGQNKHLMCSGAREYACWNGITFDGPSASHRLTNVVLETIEALPVFEPKFLQILAEELSNMAQNRESKLRQQQVKEDRHRRELENVLSAVRSDGSSKYLLEELRRLESMERELEYGRKTLEQLLSRKLHVPAVEEIRSIAREKFDQLSRESFEFTRLMQSLISEAHVFPFRLCDGGHIVLRAVIKFSASSFICSDLRQLGELEKKLSKIVVVDLFDPPQREQIRTKIHAMMQESKVKTERQLAESLGVTQPAVQNAKKLQLKMNRLGLVSPYVAVEQPPEDYKKLRRHRHRRYSFKPLSGFPRPWPD